jgi:hypothetical protein
MNKKVFGMTKSEVSLLADQLAAQDEGHEPPAKQETSWVKSLIEKTRQGREALSASGFYDKNPR